MDETRTLQDTDRLPGMMSDQYPPLRSLRDIEALERTPLEARIDSWDFAEQLRRGCAFRPDSAAIHYIDSGDPEAEPLTWRHADLWRRAMQVRELLQASGICPNDVVAVVLPTVPQLFSAMLGVVSAAVLFPINWMLSSGHVARLLASVDVKAVIALGPDPGFDIWERTQAAIKSLGKPMTVFSVHRPKGIRLTACDLDTRSSVYAGTDLTVRPQMARIHTAAFVHSGGTTGLPKVVRLTHEGFCYRLWATNQILATTPDEIVLADTPLFHIGGLIMRGLGPIASGNTVVIPSPLGARDKTYLRNYWKFIARYQISRLSGVPTTLSVLIKNPPATGEVRTLKKDFATGSTAIPTAVHKAVEKKIGVRPLIMYGMTENTGNLTLDPRDGPTKYGSAGIRLPYTEIRSVQLAPDGAIARDSRPDEIGLLVYRGPGVTPGYVDADYSAHAFIDGWFNSGDLGRIDEDGYVWLTGRAKDLIIRGGHNIDPAVIEEALLQSSDVALAAAVGKPDPHAGEVPVAYVQLVAGSEATAESLLSFARAHVSEPAAAPKEVTILEQMPLTEVGKPRKTLLRQEAARHALREAIAPVVATNEVDVAIEDNPLRGMSAVVSVGEMPMERRALFATEISRALAPFAIPHRVAFGLRARSSDAA